MEFEPKRHEEIIQHLADPDAKRYPQWVDSWLVALFTAYQQMPDKNSLSDYEKGIEPLVSWLTPESRRWLGEVLWEDRRDWLATHSVEEQYPLTGLASYLSPPVGGA